MELAGNADQSSGAFWAHDGYIYFSPESGSGIARIPEQGGDPEIPEIVVPLRPDLGDVDLRSPHVLPGGDSLLFVVRDGSGRDSIAVETLPTGVRHVLIEDGVGPQYAPTGHLVFARANSILAAPFDIDTLVVEDNPTIVIDGLQNDKFAVSEQGTLIYVDAGNNATPYSQLVSVDRQGASTPLVETPRRFWDPRWSPEGDRLAVAILSDESTPLLPFGHKTPKGSKGFAGTYFAAP